MPKSFKSNYSIRLALLVLAVMLLFSARLFGGGVLYVGGSAFDPAAQGKPLIWLNGQVTYFTDQGSLGPLLDQAAAKSFVADAFSQWTSVPTAALNVSRGGALAEDVTGQSVGINGALPSDIQPTATDKPLAMVFDNDGGVIDALLGTGASDPAFCSSNSVLGGVDNFSTTGNLSHALIIINGRCAATDTALIALKYRLARKLGEVLGLGWSQVNDNVRTNVPPPTQEDFAGFPVMHPEDLLCLLPASSNCANATLRMDDRTAISRLYPVTLQNLGQFPGKQVFYNQTIRIRGSVYFSNPRGGAGQPMQGVNVVARLIDPATGLPSRQSVSSSVSGFLFRGNAGNEVSGFAQPSGQRFDAYGSNNPLLEGFYDLAGLELPANAGVASYQVSLEAVSPLYIGNMTVGPYQSSQVTPAGDFGAATVNLSGLAAGADLVQNFILAGSAKLASDATEPSTFSSPAMVPASGEWWGSLSPYGDSDFFTLPAHANRSLDFAITTLNEGYLPSSGKAQPMLGLWLADDPAGSAPRLSQSSFNTAVKGLTRFSASIFQDAALKLGVADLRGDGRPDFIYHARLLYADAVTPTRVTVAATPIVIDGIGFQRGMTVSVGGTNASIMHIAENQIVAVAPALSDGTKTIVIQDALSGALTTMTNALDYGTASSNQLVMVNGSNPAVPVGTDAPNPVRVRVVLVDGVTGVAGVPVLFSVSPLSLLAPCGASTCTILTDDTGEASSSISMKFSGLNVVSASLNNGQKVQASILGTSSGLTLSAVSPIRFLATGTSASLVLAVKAVNGGVPASGQRINYVLTGGSGILSSLSATSDANGSASVNLTIGNVKTTTSVVACLANGGVCPQFSINAVAASNLKLRMLAGDGQVLVAGHPAQPIVLRVTDSSDPANGVVGVAVMVTEVVVADSGPSSCTIAEGVCRPVDPKILYNSSSTLVSDTNGLIGFVPTVQASWGTSRITIGATSGVATMVSTQIKLVSP